MADLNAYLNDLAIRCFRDMADQDYIVARMAYRAELVPQFLWSGLQAVEKYLKCILLLNRVDAREMGHNLLFGLEMLKSLPFDVGLSSTSLELIKHLNKYGQNRYFERSYWVHGPALVYLDKAVWELRRYCRVLNFKQKIPGKGERSMLKLELRRIEASNQRPAHKFHIPGALLERVIEKSGHPAREHLVWKNMFFGSRKRNEVSLHMHSHTAVTTLELHPEVIEEAKKYVRLPKGVIKESTRGK